MTTASPNYAGAAGTAISITLTSLGDGNWRQSAVVDNTSNLYMDAMVGGSIQVGTSPTAGGTIDIYAYGQYDATGEYTAGASGSDAAYTADGEETSLKLVDVIQVDGTSDQDYEWGPASVAAAFGLLSLPQRWGLIIENNTGATLNATGTNNEVKYTGVNFDSA